MVTNLLVLFGVMVLAAAASVGILWLCDLIVTRFEVKKNGPLIIDNGDRCVYCGCLVENCVGNFVHVQGSTVGPVCGLCMDLHNG